MLARIEHQVHFFISFDHSPDSSDRDVVQDNGDDLIHMGHAILTFYSALIDLLGRCAPEMHVSVFSMSPAFLPKDLLMSLRSTRNMRNDIHSLKYIYMFS